MAASPLGNVRKSIWQENLSICWLAFSSKLGARIFLARTVTLYTVLGARPVMVPQHVIPMHAAGSIQPQLLHNMTAIQKYTWNSTWQEHNHGILRVNYVRYIQAYYVNRALQQKEHHTSNRMPVDTGFHCPNLHIVDTHDMLVVAVARQPRYDSWRAGYVACLYVAWTQRCILANDHSACCITRCSSVGRDGTHTDPMWLQWTREI